MGERRARTIAEHDDASLVAVADVDADKARDLAGDFGCPWSSKAKQTIAEEAVDHVVVCIPNQLHEEITRVAAQAGSNVLCEKPLARTPEEGRRMVEAAATNDVTLKVSSNLRYFPSVLKAKELVEEGAIGDINFVRGWIGNDGWHLAKDWFSDGERLGGGALLDNGSHLLDIYRWFIGEVVECAGYATNTHHDVPMEDVALGIFEFSGGAYGFLQSAWTEWDDYMYMELNGSDGYIRVDNRLPDSEVILGRTDGYQERYEFSKLPPSSYDNEMADYIDRVNQDKKPIPTGFDGLRAVQMAHGVYRATRNREFVDLWTEADEEFIAEIDGVENTTLGTAVDGETQ